MSTVDWSALSADEAKALLLCTNRRVSIGLERLDSGLNVVEDLSSALVPGSGSVKWNGPTADQPDGVEWGVSATLALADELGAADLVRFSKTITDTDTGLSARGYMGAYYLSFPQRVAGTTVRADDGSQLLPFAVTGQGRSSILDWSPGYSYVALDKDPTTSAPIMVLDNVRQVFTDVGIPLSSVLIDGSRATAPMPRPMVWPLVSTDSGGQATVRQILADLLALIAYQPPYMTGAGYISCTPDFDPSTAAPAFRHAVDLGPGWVTSLAPTRTRLRDLAGVPNQEVFVWQDMVDGSGASITPTTANGGILTISNASTGPTSIAALGGSPAGLRSKPPVYLSAAALDDFTAQAQLQAATDQRLITRYQVGTVPWPAAGHRDVFDYNDPGATSSSGDVRVVASSWESPLSDADTTWTWDAVSA